MTTHASTERSIFLEAIEKPSEVERRAFVERACLGDPQLKAEVQVLLRAHQESGDLLDAPEAIVRTIDQPPCELPGALIGPYKLLEQIGEGGMGLVYMAEQQQPVRRLVALKLVKPGMDSKQVIARFEAEKQALAMMDHQNIAKVLDAGTTNTGRPYFAMELVRGIPINEFCDETRLSARERLELMVQVCQAVQHAHQKGIIHRDLKPSNVLVTMNDATPLPKVIDFGIAKALGSSLTDHTLHTGFAQLVGTPLYMSPEQASLNHLGVDTRSDVYSLGVLLYELLTGTTPFDKETLTKAGLDEMRRIIREDEPLRPSVRVSTLDAKALSTVSQGRNTDPRRISIILRGELDWIVMKALEKDRSRRYESASALAADIQRYLADEPVQACPPSTLYRFRKFARKNKAALTTAAAIAASLLLCALISTYQALRATAAEAQATANEAKAKSEEQKALAAVAAERTAKESEAVQRRQAEDSGKRAEKNLEAALDGVDRLLSRVGSPEMQDIPNARKVQRSMAQDAIDLYERLSIDNRHSPAIRHRAAKTWSRLGGMHGFLEADMAQKAHDTAVAMMRELVAEDRASLEFLQSLASVVNTRAYFYRTHLDDHKAATSGLEEALGLLAELARRSQTPQERDAALDTEVRTLMFLSMSAGSQKNGVQALEYIERALAIGKEIRDPSAHSIISALNQKAGLIENVSPETKDALHRDIIARHREWAKNNPELNTTRAQASLGNYLYSAAHSMSRRLPHEADEYYAESVEINRKWTHENPFGVRSRRESVKRLSEFAQHHRWHAANTNSLENAEQKAHRLVQADALFQEATKIERQLTAEFPDVKVRAPGDVWGPPHQVVLADLLREQAIFILGQLDQGKDGASNEVAPDDHAARKREADALLTEAIIIRRALAAEFPDNANYKNRLADVLKLQAQHFGPKKDGDQ